MELNNYVNNRYSKVQSALKLLRFLLDVKVDNRNRIANTKMVLFLRRKWYCCLESKVDRFLLTSMRYSYHWKTFVIVSAQKIPKIVDQIIHSHYDRAPISKGLSWYLSQCCGDSCRRGGVLLSYISNKFPLIQVHSAPYVEKEIAYGKLKTQNIRKVFSNSNFWFNNFECILRVSLIFLRVCNQQLCQLHQSLKGKDWNVANFQTEGLCFQPYRVIAGNKLESSFLSWAFVVLFSNVQNFERRKIPVGMDLPCYSPPKVNCFP